MTQDRDVSPQSYERFVCQGFFNQFPSFSYSIPIVPASVNSQYIHRGKGRQFDLDPRIKELRDLTALELRGREWKPQGALTAFMFFYSPSWVTKQGFIRISDVDNRIKATLDAFERVTNIGDERNWMVTGIKCLSNVERTSVHLFDVGKTIHAYRFKEVLKHLLTGDGVLYCGQFSMDEPALTIAQSEGVSPSALCPKCLHAFRGAMKTVRKFKK